MKLWKRMFARRERREAERLQQGLEHVTLLNKRKFRKHQEHVNDVRLLHVGRISAYRAQRGLPTLRVDYDVTSLDEDTRTGTAQPRLTTVLGKPSDLTPRQRRRLRHKFNAGDPGLLLEEIFGEVTHS